MTSQVYNLDGPKEFPFPYPVRAAAQLTVEIVPGNVVSPGDYEVVGVGPTSTQVTVRYPNAPTTGGLQLKISRYVAPERVTVIDDPSDITTVNLNAEFNNIYEALIDFEEFILNLVQQMLDDFQNDVLDPALAEINQARDDAIAAKDAAEAAQQGAEEAEQGATAAWDAFQDRYWGAYPTDPSVSPVGNPPTAGDLYWNTTVNQWRAWDANQGAWVSVTSAVPTYYDRRNYIATEGQTTFEATYDAGYVQVWVNGLLLPPSDYEASTGTNVVLDEGVAAGTEVSIVGLGAVAIGVLDGDNAMVTTLTGNQLLPAALNDRVAYVPDITALRALTGMQEGQATQITSTGRAGLFRWDGGDLKAECDADPQMGIYVPLTGQDGSAGAWVRQYGQATTYIPQINLAWFGIESGDDITQAVLSAKGLGKLVSIPDGSFTCRPIKFTPDDTGLEIFGAGKGKTTIQMTGDYTSNVAMLHNPRVGDNYGGATAPADNLVLHGFSLDGSMATSTNFTTGIFIAGGKGVRVYDYEAYNFQKSGLLVASGVGELIEFWGDDIVSHHNGDGGAGLGVATNGLNEFDSIKFGTIIAYNNGAWGVNASGGQTTHEYIEVYENGAAVPGSGGGIKFTGGIQRLRIGTLKTHNNSGNGLSSNSSDTTSVVIDHIEAIDNSASGVNLAHGGDYAFGSVYARGNVGSGVRVSGGANVEISSLVTDGNSGNGLSAVSDAGSVTVGALVGRNHVAGAAAVITSTAQVEIGTVLSVNNDNGGVRVVGSSTQSQITIGPVSIHNDAPGTSAYGVFLNSNADNVVIGKITATGSALAISDGGVDTYRHKRRMTASQNYDPGSIPSGSQDSTTMSVPGAALGDFAVASFSEDLEGVTLSASVTAADTVTVTFTNSTGSVVDLALGTVRVAVTEK